MGYSNWDKGTVNDDGTISGSWYIVDVDYAACYEIYNTEPVGHKTVPAEAVLEGKRYVIKTGGRYLAAMPTDWAQLVHRVKAKGSLAGEAYIKWRAYDEPQRFMVTFSLKGA